MALVKQQETLRDTKEMRESDEDDIRRRPKAAGCLLKRQLFMQFIFASKVLR